MNYFKSIKLKTMLYHNWNQWTTRSIHVDFFYKEQGEGNGERKLAAEFLTVPKGQNYSFDILVKDEEWEIKELDDDNSHRIGVEVSSSYSVIKRHALRIIEGINNVSSSECKCHYSNLINKLIAPQGRNRTSILEGLQKNELSESNLELTQKIITSLVGQKSLLSESKKILYSSVDGELYEYDHRSAFRKINVENISDLDKIELLGGKELFFWLLATDDSSESIDYFQNIGLRERLNNLVRMPFESTRLVLVDSNKGYFPVDDLSIITCNRITQGNPRIRINL